jgi:hypothetical protein
VAPFPPEKFFPRNGPNVEPNVEPVPAVSTV